MIEILKEAISILNQIPRKKINHYNYKDTYEWLSNADKVVAQNKDQYYIKLSAHQLQTTKDALEWYSRFLMGQVDHLPPVIAWSNKVSRWKLEELFKPVKEYLFPKLPWGGFYNIGDNEHEFSKEAQISYEIYRKIYEFDVQQRKANGDPCLGNVYAREGLHYTNEPKVVIEQV